MTWYVEFPTFQYNEDVKEVAKKRGLKIIDKVFQGKNKQCENPPKLTKKGQVASNEKEEAKQ